VTRADIDAVLARHSDELADLHAKVDQHGIILAEHTAKLNALKRTQDAHTELLQEILRRLPAPDEQPANDTER